MKNSILLYLVILVALTNVFTYAYFDKQVEFERQRFDRLDKKMKDTINLLLVKNSDAEYFSLESNQNAQDYFINQSKGTFISHEKLIPIVKDKLLDFNANLKGNPYTGFEQIDGKKFIINKIKILNHRWIIADFNNGELWGEAIIKYFVDDEQNISFETAETLIYPKSQK